MKVAEHQTSVTFIFSDTAKFYFTLSNISSHFDSNLFKRTNRN